MSKHIKLKKAQEQKKRRQRVILCLAVGATICAVLLAFKVIPYVSDMIAFRREQAFLSAFDGHWLDLNPDYAGWLKIDGTSIDFPVVRGSDNVKYLTTTFRGEENILGAVFMDYRCAGVDMPHIIIYGHQARDEQDNRLLFGSLHEFLDEQFLAEHPTIMWMENDKLYEFEIFSARQTDIHDPAYRLDFNADNSWAAFLERNGAPSDAEQVITLSTCIGTDNDRRMIVQGALQRVVPVTTEQDENGGWSMVRPPE